MREVSRMLCFDKSSFSKVLKEPKNLIEHVGNLLKLRFLPRAASNAPKQK